MEKKNASLHKAVSMLITAVMVDILTQGLNGQWLNCESIV